MRSGKVRAAMAEASEHHRPGEPPPVRDEAADTPLWLPVLGLCFLVLGAFAIIWQAQTADEPTSDEAAAQEREEETSAAAAGDEAEPGDDAPAEPSAE